MSPTKAKTPKKKAAAKKPATARFRPTLRDHRRLSDAIDEAIAQATANQVWTEEALALLKENHRRLIECAKRERELEAKIADLKAQIKQQERPLLMDQAKAEAMSAELRKKRKFRAKRIEYAYGQKSWHYYNAADVVRPLKKESRPLLFPDELAISPAADSPVAADSADSPSGFPRLMSCKEREAFDRSGCKIWHPSKVKYAEYSHSGGIFFVYRSVVDPDAPYVLSRLGVPASAVARVLHALI